MNVENNLFLSKFAAKLYFLHYDKRKNQYHPNL